MIARSPSSLLAAVAACFALAAAVALVSPALGRSDVSSPERRPDLVQRVPADLETRQNGSRSELGFDSAVDNRGTGPLRVNGRRRSASGDMVADQVVRRADGSSARVPRVGTIRYTVAEGHEHWHLLGFDVYELRRASDHARVRADRKTGFCLGDRYDSGYRSRHKPSRAILNTDCRKNQTEALTVGMGISVGYGDDYRAYLEGQSIDVTGLAAGQYELVHRANADRRLRESRYSNNAASVRFSLSWPHGSNAQPSVRVLERCPGAERCAP